MGPVVGPLKGTRFWMWCEHFIRKAAGLGAAGHAHDKARYERMSAFCDTLVVGSGPAGLAAARAAAAGGGRVILAELDAAFGGSAKWSGETIDGQPAPAWAAEQVEALRAMPNVRLQAHHGLGLLRFQYLGRAGTRHRPQGAGRQGRAEASPLDDPRRPRRARHRRVRAAAGVPRNDRPGVMLASAAERYAAEFGVLPGDKIALFANNDTAYRVAASLAKAARVTTIVDVRADPSPAARALAAEAGADLLAGHAVVGTEGGKALSGIKVQRFDAEPAPVGRGPQHRGGCLTDLRRLVAGGAPRQPGRRAAGVEHGASGLSCCCTAATAWIGIGGAKGTFDNPVWPSRTGALWVFPSPGHPSQAKTPGVFEGAVSALDSRPAPIFEIPARGKAFVDFQLDVTARTSGSPTARASFRSST